MCNDNKRGIPLSITLDELFYNDSDYPIVSKTNNFTTFTYSDGSSTSISNGTMDFFRQDVKPEPCELRLVFIDHGKIIDPNSL